MTSPAHRSTTGHRLAKTLLGLAAWAAVSGAQAQSAAELAQRLDQLGAELAKVKAQLAALQTQAAPAVAPVAAPNPVAPEAKATEPATVIGSYGELNFSRPTRAGQNAQADVRRLVLGISHRFDERTKLVTELEVEHAVASAGDVGEVAVEQAYVERQLNPQWALRAGLFLMPVGLLNENHEPTAFHGVERNFVETAIIPTTWREGGVQLVGSFDNGLTLQTGLATSFDLNKWDATSAEGRESPLGAIHQEMAQAKAHDLGAFAAVNWRGVPGLLLGGSVFSGKATQGQAAAAGSASQTASRITLWDLHARWQPGQWDLSALYSRGHISNTAAWNLPLVGSASLIPQTFDGAYVQAAYKLWSRQDMAFTPFARWERFNTARSFADLGAGLTPAAARSERVFTLGADLQLTQGVVLKADLQRFTENRDANRVNLGLGWSF